MDFSSILFSILILGILGLLFGILLGFASKKFEVKVDERIPRIREVLPGANCGGCGYPGCDAYATAIVEDGVDATLCGVGGPSVSKAIGKILGVEIKKVEKKVAYIKCNGDCTKKKVVLNIPEGIGCTEAKEYISNNEVSGCSYGCFGFGECAKVCKFGAITVVNGLAQIDSSKCVACKACVRVCPQNLIDIIKEEQKIIVKCNSKDAGKVVNENCSVGCIGCKICEKNCPTEAIKVDSFLASIDYEKCTSCGICKDKCPKKTINSRQK